MSLIALNAGRTKIARANGFRDGRDFVAVHDWPGGLDNLRWAGDQYGWQRADDPRYFACCWRAYDET